MIRDKKAIKAPKTATVFWKPTGKCCIKWSNRHRNADKVHHTFSTLGYIYGNQRKCRKKIMRQAKAINMSGHIGWRKRLAKDKLVSYRWRLSQIYCFFSISILLLCFFFVLHDAQIYYYWLIKRRLDQQIRRTTPSLLNRSLLTITPFVIENGNVGYELWRSHTLWQSPCVRVFVYSWECASDSGRRRHPMSAPIGYFFHCP